METKNAFRARCEPAVQATLLIGVALALAAAGCGQERDSEREIPITTRSLRVTATAYNSVPAQTDSEPSVAAWGDRLEPGMKALAVSRDLIEEGLTRGTRVRIEGLEDEYVVLDKTARRFTRRIDIYMGTDVARAREFGVRKVRIYWSE